MASCEVNFSGAAAGGIVAWGPVKNRFVHEFDSAVALVAEWGFQFEEIYKIWLALFQINAWYVQGDLQHFASRNISGLNDNSFVTYLWPARRPVTAKISSVDKSVTLQTCGQVVNFICFGTFSGYPKSRLHLHETES